MGLCLLEEMYCVALFLIPLKNGKIMDNKIWVLLQKPVGF